MGSLLPYVWERQGDGGRQRQTAIVTHNFNLLLLLTTPWCVIFRALHLCLLGFPARGHCRPLPHRATGGQSPWLIVSRPKSPDCGLIPARLAISVVGRKYIIPRIPVVTHVTCFQYLHWCFLQSHSLHSWNIRRSQRPICNKGMNALIHPLLPAMGKIVPLLFFNEDRFSNK